jgi:hypothetical protein
MATLRIKDTRYMNRTVLSALGGLLCLAQGCAEPVEDINVIHDKLLPKTMFEGTWYYRQMVVGSDPTISWGGMIGLEADTEKVVWEVREDQLIAYRSHEGVPGIDEDDTLPGSKYKGEPIASFPIGGHFDIERGYNAQTGEQNNSIGTNSSDRPWYERTYIDLSFNTAVGSPADFGIYFDFTPVAHDFSDWDDTYRYSPDQPVYEKDYIEFTNIKEIIDDYSCWYLYGESGACSGGAVKLRHSFRKVDEARASQFETRDYDDLLPVNEDGSREPIRTTYLPVPLTRLAGGTDPTSSCETNEDCPQGDNFSSSCIQNKCRSSVFGRTNADARRFRMDFGIAEASSECEVSTDCVFGLACVDGECGTCFGNSDCGEGEVCVRGLDEGKSQDFRFNGGECSLAYAQMACTAELFEALDNTFAPDTFKAQDCEDATVQQLERFGIFRTERPGYDRETGSNRDEGRNYLANIHNIWQAAYETGDDGLADKSKPIPMKDRDPKPIVYHLSVGFPEDLAETNVQVMKDWNAAMMGAVRAATGRTDDAIAEQIRTYSQAQAEDAFFLEGDAVQHGGMYQIRENNCSFRGIDAYLKRHPEYFGLVEGAVAADERSPASEFTTTGRKYNASAANGLKGMLKIGNLPRVCSALTRATLDDGVRNASNDGVDPFRWQKIGDLRYSFLAWINEKQPDGPLGYGPSSTDGETGEVVVANANIYGASLDGYARSAVDTVRAINGDLTSEDILDGISTQEWLARTRSIADAPSGLTRDAAQTYETRRLRALGVEATELEAREMSPRFQAMKPLEIRQQARTLRTPETALSPGQARMEKLMSDPLVAEMIVPTEVKALIRATHRHRPGEDAEESTEAAMRDFVGNPHRFHDRARQRHALLEEARVDTFEMVDDAIIGKALELKGKNPEELYVELRKEVYRAVTLHEIGHTMGLTHNFAGSFDALNYQDEYWKILSETPAGDGSDEDTVNDRLQKRLPEYTYSTIMDYHGRFNSDDKGLGKYDLAAMKFAYGKTIEVFEDDVDVPTFPFTDIYIKYVWGNDTLPNIYGESVSNLAKRKDVPIEDVLRDRYEQARANLDKGIQTLYEPTTGFKAPREVPYQFCEHAYLGNVGCRTFDQGSSHPEIVRNAIQNYWNYYRFNNYRRGRREMTFYDGWFGRQQGIMEDLTYAIRYYIYVGSGERVGRDYLEAALTSFNFINQVLGTPVPGRHCLDTRTNTYVLDQTSNRCEDELQVKDGDGREPYIRFNDERETLETFIGGRIDYIGSFYDKFNFLYFLMDDSTRFFNVTDFGDSRRFSINYYRLFPNEITAMMRDLVFSHLGIGGGGVIGPVVDADGNLQPPVLAPANDDQAEPENAPRVVTAVPRALAFQSLLISSVFNSSPFDLEFDFMERMLLFEEGSAEARTLPAEKAVARFTDPLTGVNFIAPQAYTEDSISFDLLTYFQEYTTEVFEPARAAVDENPSDTAAQAAFEDAKLRVGRFSDFVNDFRWIRAATEPYFD